MSQFSKLQIRAKVLSVISEIRSSSTYNEDSLTSFIDELKNIEDKETLFDIFLKEYIKMEENEYVFSGCILKNIVPKEYINDKVLEQLKSNVLSDESKYKLVQLLRLVGSECNYNEIPSYFENPEEVLDKETKKLLESAVFNPEAMLDFLDFVSAVSAKDRNLLLDSLKLDYEGDVLANIIYPVLYSNYDDSFILEVINILSDSKSSLAIKPFKYLIETSSNQEIIKACRTGLKKLKLSGATEEKAYEYFRNIVKDTIPAEFFTTIPDGSGNQALLLSRQNKKEKYILVAIVINDKSGIIDCFGFFNISKEELIKVIGKFYKSEGKYKVKPEYVKTKIEEAIDITIKTKHKFPYEFICWNTFTSDLNVLDTDLKTYIETNCKQQLISKNDMLNLLTKEYTLRWFITPSENILIKLLVDGIYKEDEPNIEDINEKIKDSIDKIFDEKEVIIWQNRFFNLIYLLRNNSLLKEADNFYTILKNNDLFTLFKVVIIQRSIFNYYVGLKENIKESFFTTNIFSKKNATSKSYDIKKIEKIINILKRHWIDE
ncbi:TPA: hypothetical protein IAA87_07170 [Candidatus Avigastranaerophilus faecigallinarum]|nr:hypothetical protein [Candidatus Avigastranaerophilus faecigallinarum]